VQQAEQAKLQRFQDSIRKRLTELRRDTEASVATLGRRSTEFPAGASLSDFFKWFQKEIESMSTAFVKCNENVTCYALIGVFQMLVGEGCEHLPEPTEPKKLALTCDASVLRGFPVETGRIAKNLVINWWTKHGLPYCMQQIEEQNQVSCGIYSLQASVYVSSDCLFLSSLKLMKASKVNTPMRVLKRAETTCEWRLLCEGPPWLKQLVMIRRRKQTYLRRLL
jgi:hypothetical protein